MAGRSNASCGDRLPCLTPVQGMCTCVERQEVKREKLPNKLTLIYETAISLLRKKHDLLTNVLMGRVMSS